MKLTHQGVTRHETDETIIATLLRKGWVEAPPDPVPEPTPMPPPEQVTKRQLLHWLEFDQGVMHPEDTIVAMITNHVPDAQRAFALKDWSRTYYIKFANPLVPLLAAALQISDVAKAFREMEEKYG